MSHENLSWGVCAQVSMTQTGLLSYSSLETLDLASTGSSEQQRR